MKVLDDSFIIREFESSKSNNSENY